MSTSPRPQRRIHVRGVRRRPADLQRLARAIIELAQAQVEADAQAEQEAKTVATDKGSSSSNEAEAA